MRRIHTTILALLLIAIGPAGPALAQEEEIQDTLRELLQDQRVDTCVSFVAPFPTFIDGEVRACIHPERITLDGGGSHRFQSGFNVGPLSGSFRSFAGLSTVALANDFSVEQYDFGAFTEMALTVDFELESIRSEGTFELFARSDFGVSNGIQLDYGFRTEFSVLGRQVLDESEGI